MRLDQEIKYREARAREDGHAAGLSEGHAAGLSEGRDSKAKEIASNLKAAGMDAKDIAINTGLSEKEINKLWNSVLIGHRDNQVDKKTWDTNKYRTNGCMVIRAVFSFLLEFLEYSFLVYLKVEHAFPGLTLSKTIEISKFDSPVR